MSAKLPPITQELREAALWFIQPENIGVETTGSMPDAMHLLLVNYLDVVDPRMHVGCAAIHILARLLPKWNTDKPDVDTTVLVRLEGGNDPVWVGSWDGEYWVTPEGIHISDAVTGWMNFPTP